MDCACDGESRCSEHRFIHFQDNQCTVDPETDLCKGCGVYHGYPCPWCSGRAFHRPNCELLESR